MVGHPSERAENEKHVSPWLLMTSRGCKKLNTRKHIKLTIDLSIGIHYYDPYICVPRNCYALTCSSDSSECYKRMNTLRRTDANYNYSVRQK